jgi:nitrate/nitrite transport system ATP-binding protein
MTDTTPFLELRDVHKSYGFGAQRSEVLRGIDLTIERGELLAIVGYSGAGKSTLISLLAGLLVPDSGSIMFCGRPVRAPGPERAVVFQNYSLLPWLSVFDNIHLAVAQVFGGRWTRAEQVAHTERYIALVNLSSARDKKPAQLSGGMRQRVALARALAMEPELLLLDEPLSALDALTRATLQDELARICRVSQKTILLITNDVDEGILIADRIIPLGPGPAAVLGPAIAVDIERPRDRKALNHDPRFKRLRNEVIDYLLSAARTKRAAKAAKSPQLRNLATDPL